MRYQESLHGRRERRWGARITGGPKCPYGSNDGAIREGRVE
jgi:hypothetical protein